jgi:hypothetical protein
MKIKNIVQFLCHFFSLSLKVIHHLVLPKKKLMVNWLGIFHKLKWQMMTFERVISAFSSLDYGEIWESCGINFREFFL